MWGHTCEYRFTSPWVLGYTRCQCKQFSLIAQHLWFITLRIEPRQHRTATDPLIQINVVLSRRCVSAHLLTLGILPVVALGGSFVGLMWHN